MAMLQYRHKTRAFRQMVTLDEAGNPRRHQGPHRPGHHRGRAGRSEPRPRPGAADAAHAANRTRLEPRLPGLPDDATLRARLDQLSAETLHTLVVSDQWDSGNVGGEEVDVDWLLPEPEASTVPEPRGPGRAGEGGAGGRGEAPRLAAGGGRTR